MALLNRNTCQSAIVDPDANFLESVKFFLEPLSDGSLPAYNIQRDIFMALHRLPIEKETLMASGIGKIVLFYTKSKKAEKGVKRLAEQLLGDWSRPILRKTHDYRQRHVETRDFDYQYVAFHRIYVATLTPASEPPSSVKQQAHLSLL
jgi:transcription factor SPN1